MGVTGCWEFVWLYWFLPPYQRTKSLACKAQRPLTLVLPFGFLPNLRAAGIAPTALALRLRSRAIGPINLPLACRSDGPLAPGFWGVVRAIRAADRGVTPNPCSTLRLLAGFDMCQIRQRLPALGQVLQGAPARAGAVEFTTIGIAPTPLALRLAPSGNRTDQSATGRLLRRSSGTRPSRARRAVRGDGLPRHPRALPIEEAAGFGGGQVCHDRHQVGCRLIR